MEPGSHPECTKPLSNLCEYSIRKSPECNTIGKSPQHLPYLSARLFLLVNGTERVENFFRKNTGIIVPLITV